MKFTAAEYRALTLFDADANDIAARAFDNIAARFPEWTPREADLPVVLIEAMATEVAETVYALNRVPDLIAERIVGLFGITRNDAIEPRGRATFTLTPGTGDRTIPAGTRLTIGTDGPTLATVTDLTITQAAGTGSVDVVGVGIESADYNNTPTGTGLLLADAVAYVDRVTLTGALTGGVPAEDDNAFMDRAMSVLSRLTDTLVTIRDFTAAALEDPRVAQVQPWDRHMPDSFLVVQGALTLFVVGPGGATLSDADLKSVRDSLQARAISNLRVYVANATLAAVDVTSTITLMPGYAEADVVPAVNAAIAEALSPVKAENGATVYRNEIVATIDRVDGVDHVVTVTLSGTNLTANGNGDISLSNYSVPSSNITTQALPKPGKITTTVVTV